MAKTTFSIVIPVWNCASYICNCLDSVLNQSYQNIEVIVIDDASTDEIEGVLAYYLKKDSRVVLYTNFYNQGLGKCRNIGLSKAHGKYVFFVDADDFLAEGTLAAVAQNLKDEDVLLFNGAAFRQEDMHIEKPCYLSLQPEYFEKGRIKEEYLLRLYDSHTACMKVYAADFLKRYNIRFPEGVYGEDVEFWIRCLINTHKIGYLPYFGYMRRYRENSIMTSGSEKNLSDRFDSLATLLELTQANRQLYLYIVDYYLRGLCRKAIAQSRDFYRRMFPMLVSLSEKYQLGISSDLVSVVIPVYNNGDRILDTVGSVLDQTHLHTEILIIDDGSEEDIAALLKTLHDDRIIYYRLSHTNANVSRNFGIQKATGKYIAMLDADDIWKPDHLTDCINVLKQTGADGLYGDLLVRYESGKEVKITASAPQQNESMINYLLRTGFGAQTSTLFLSAKSAKDILWDENLKRHQDYDYIVRYSKRYRFAVKNGSTVIYRYLPSKQKVDFKSCMRVIKAWKEEIEPETYYNYNKGMFWLAVKWEAEPEIIEYYRKEVLANVEYLSFEEFFVIHAPQDDNQLEYLKRKYLELVRNVEVDYKE